MTNQKNFTNNKNIDELNRKLMSRITGGKSDNPFKPSPTFPKVNPKKK